jgi:hypothetical protein
LWMRKICIVPSSEQDYQCEDEFCSFDVENCRNNDWKVMIDNKYESFRCQPLQKHQLMWHTCGLGLTWNSTPKWAKFDAELGLSPVQNKWSVTQVKKTKYNESILKPHLLEYLMHYECIWYTKKKKGPLWTIFVASFFI